MLIEVTAQYLFADNIPDRGYLLFTPSVLRGDSTASKHIITQSPVKAVLDAFGKISVFLTDSYDLGWMSNNKGQPIPYKVQGWLSGSNFCYYTIIKGPSPFDLSDSIPADDSGIIVVIENEVVVDTKEPAAYEIYADTSVIYPLTP